MDSKPDIDYFIGEMKIGTVSHHRIRFGRSLMSGKTIFTSTKFFALIDKIMSTGDEAVISNVVITSSSGRTYTIEKFLNSLEYCEEVR